MLPNHYSTIVTSVEQAVVQPVGYMLPPSLRPHSYESLTRLTPALLDQEWINDQLLDLASLPNGWDGEGAAAISDNIVNRVKTILSQTRSLAASPDLIPNTNGTISLEWESDDRFIHLEIGENDFSLLLGSSGTPPRGMQGLGLPNAGLLGPLLSQTFYGQQQIETSITAEKLAA